MPLLCTVLLTAQAQPFLTTGVKVGEVTSSNALLWVRLTAHPHRNPGGVQMVGPVGGVSTTVPADLTTLEGACPGASGRVLVTLDPGSDRSRTFGPISVDASTDFASVIELGGLVPGRSHSYEVSALGHDASQPGAGLRGRFRTAPMPDQAATVRFCVVTGQAYRDLDHPEGYNIYPAMQALDPDFVVFTGDNVYYDNEQPKAVNAALARYHWERMYSLPRHVDLLRSVGSYWEKDDHDIVENDCWPGRSVGQLTFAEGQRVFRGQTPTSGAAYRTFRWGRDLQIWLTEGRDFRSPNRQIDGPDKTIWGVEQKAWLRRTLAESDATWKIVISPTPIVGPDRSNKGDNHANAAFAHEGGEMRAWFRDHGGPGLVIACGDRHWQYHSVDPETGVREFCCGPASDEHAGGSPGEDSLYHRFHRVKGGFLSVAVVPAGRRAELQMRHHDVRGGVLYEWRQDLPCL